MAWTLGNGVLGVSHGIPMQSFYLAIFQPIALLQSRFLCCDWLKGDNTILRPFDIKKADILGFKFEFSFFSNVEIL